MISFLLASNISDGAIVALKMMGGVVAAAVILYLILILSRILGTKIEDKKYDTYCQNYRNDHGNTEGMLSKKDFIEMRASGKAVVWKRQESSASDDPATPEESDNATETKAATSAVDTEDANDPDGIQENDSAANIDAEQVSHEAKDASKSDSSHAENGEEA